MTFAARDALLSRLAGASWPLSPLLDALKLPFNAEVLDVGAGDGALLAALQKCGHTGRLVGLDPQPGGGILRGFAEKLPFSSDTFDAVLMVRMLGHVQNKAKALTEARRVLHRGGRLVLASNGTDHLRETWRALGQPLSERGPDGVLHDVLYGAGLKAERLEIHLPVAVIRADALELARTYGLEASLKRADFPMRDTLHLAVYVHEKGL